MATYIATLHLTKKGVQGIHDTCERAAAFKAEAKKMGVKVTEVYWTLGPFDGVIVFSAPDDETATAAMLQVSSHGNVQTSTCRAFASSEMKKIVDKLPSN